MDVLSLMYLKKNLHSICSSDVTFECIFLKDISVWLQQVAIDNTIMIWNISEKLTYTV